MKASSAHGVQAYLDLLTNAQIRPLLTAAIVLQMAQQLCGINAVFYYSSSFLEDTLPSPLLGSALVALVNVLATYLALVLMDYTARRTLLLISAGGMCISAGVIVAALLGMCAPWVALVAGKLKLSIPTCASINHPSIPKLPVCMCAQLCHHILSL